MLPERYKRATKVANERVTMLMIAIHYTITVGGEYNDS
jgi:hypothetical protein